MSTTASAIASNGHVVEKAQSPPPRNAWEGMWIRAVEDSIRWGRKVILVILFHQQIADVLNFLLRLADKL